MMQSTINYPVRKHGLRQRGKEKLTSSAGKENSPQKRANISEIAPEKLSPSKKLREPSENERVEKVNPAVHDSHMRARSRRIVTSETRSETKAPQPSVTSEMRSETKVPQPGLSLEMKLPQCSVRVPLSPLRNCVQSVVIKSADKEEKPRVIQVSSATQPNRDDNVINSVVRMLRYEVTSLNNSVSIKDVSSGTRIAEHLSRAGEAEKQSSANNVCSQSRNEKSSQHNINNVEPVVCDTLNIKKVLFSDPTEKRMDELIVKKNIVLDRSKDCYKSMDRSKVSKSIDRCTVSRDNSKFSSSDDAVSLVDVRSYEAHVDSPAKNLRSRRDVMSSAQQNDDRLKSPVRSSEVTRSLTTPKKSSQESSGVTLKQTLDVVGSPCKDLESGRMMRSMTPVKCHKSHFSSPTRGPRNKTPVKRDQHDIASPSKVLRSRTPSKSDTLTSPTRVLRSMTPVKSDKYITLSEPEEALTSIILLSPNRTLRSRTPVKCDTIASPLRVLRSMTPSKSDRDISPTKPEEILTPTKHSTILLSPTRVLRSASKGAQPPEGEGGCFIESLTPSKAACRNLGNSFSGSAASSVMKLSRQSGACYQRVKNALHTAAPDTLIGREKEEQEISAFLYDNLTNHRSASMYISGAPGTGKTAVLSKILDKLRADFSSTSTRGMRGSKSAGGALSGGALSGGALSGGTVVYVNCMTLRNSASIYRHVLESLTENKNRNLSVRQTQDEIELCLKQATTATNQDVLYTLFDWPTLTLSSPLVLLGVANSLDLTDRILPRLQARPNCKPRLLNFTPYTREQISAVLEHRLAQVGGDVVFDRAGIQFLSRKVSCMSGDVRVALDTARRAVECVETEARKQSVLIPLTGSPSKQSRPKVGVSQVMKVVNEVYGSKVGGGGKVGGGSKGGEYPLQQTLCVCTLLMMSKSGKGKEVPLGKFHESYTRVCKRHGVTQIDQSEFLSLVTLIESRGLFTLKRAKETRNFKVSLRMNEAELETELQDKRLVTDILNKGL